MEQLIDSKKSKELNWKQSFGVGAVIGAVFFIVIYGFKVLDVTYDDWLFLYE